MVTAVARRARAPAEAGLAVRPPDDGGGRAALWWPWLLVAAAVIWNLASLRALAVGVPYLNDSSCNELSFKIGRASCRERV